MGAVTRFPKIDLHIHLAGTGCCNSGCSVSDEFRKRFTFRALQLLQGISKQQLNHTIDGDWASRVAAMVAGSELDYGVVLGMDAVYEQGLGIPDAARSQLVVPPEWVFQVCRAHRGLLPGPSVNPHSRDALDRLAYCIDQGAVLIKWLPISQAIDPGSPRLKPFYRLLADHRIPLLVHMGGERTFKAIAPEYNNVGLLEPALDEGVKVIIAHAGTRILPSREPDQSKRIKDMLRHWDRLWVDNSGLLNPSRFVHAPAMARDEELTQKMLYGSDWPVPSSSVYFTAMLGWRKVLALESNRNPLARDVMTKRLLGFPDATLTRANLVLANLHRWMGPSSLGCDQ